MVDKLFFGNDIDINQNIHIHHPTLDEIYKYGEEKYYQMVSKFCSTPFDNKVFLLDNFGLDYENIDEFDFFYILIKSLNIEDTRILFGELNFQNFLLLPNKQTNEKVLVNPETEVIIDKSLYYLITDCIRKMHNLKKDLSIAGNAHTKKYLIDKERRFLKRQKNIKRQPMLIPLISTLVNCEEFKYNYETVWNLPIYLFMDSVKRIQKIKNHNYLMQGIYSGAIDPKKLTEDDLNLMKEL